MNVNVKSNRDPMDYSTKRQKPLTRQVSMDGVKDFFVKYMWNDNLGQIAHAHVVHSDREKEGIFSQKALTLAHLHSTAVDFAKKRVPAEVPPELLIRNEKVNGLTLWVRTEAYRIDPAEHWEKCIGNVSTLRLIQTQFLSNRGVLQVF